MSVDQMPLLMAQLFVVCAALLYAGLVSLVLVRRGLGL